MAVPPPGRTEITLAMKNQATHSPQPEDAESPPAQKGAQESMEKIRRLKAKASRGLFALALFIAVSIGAVQNFEFLPPFSPHIRAILGTPPSANMISAALMLYSFSAIILILARMMSGSGSYSGFSHVGYLTAFFAFYHFSGALDENFWAVFAAGITVLGLESYHIWTFCTEEIKKEQENLAAPARNGGSGEGAGE